MSPPPERRLPLWHLALMLSFLVLSALGPADRFTWFLETVPIMLGLPLMALSARRFPLTPLLLALIVVHAGVLALGGAYTYAEVPLGAWAEQAFGLARNPYDRLGHLAQGFVPAILTREILLRRTLLVRGAWLSFLSISVCLAFSAFYELIEWWAALASGEAAEAFLGTQGDVWDTQWDMCLALVGACLSLVLLSGIHERQLVGLKLGPQECPHL